MSSEILPVIQRTDEDLVQLALELYCRSFTYRSKQLHDAAFEAITELKRRLGQRDAALKLADKWKQYAANFREQSKDWLASLPKNVDPPSYIHDECAADLRAIFAPKDEK